MIECVTISVYDTTLPDVGVGLVPVNIAGANTCKLVYEGSEDKFLTIMSSALEFSMEVNVSKQPDTDLFYESLFTGDEKRFSVILTDQDDVVLWKGFLLPDEYGEPYEAGTFYPGFTATDGITFRIVFTAPGIAFRKSLQTVWSKPAFLSRFISIRR